MLEKSEAKKYYEMGKQALSKHNDLFDAMYEEKIPDFWPIQKAFQMGFDGTPWVIKQYERLGNVPEGPSYNYREQMPEKGVSVITDEWKQSIAGMLFVNKNRNRKTTKFNGIFTGFYGGDGEPLVLPVK